MLCEECNIEMETESIGCGGDPYRIYYCPNCFRREKIGMGRIVLNVGRHPRKP